MSPAYEKLLKNLLMQSVSGCQKEVEIARCHIRIAWRIDKAFPTESGNDTWTIHLHQPFTDFALDVSTAYSFSKTPLTFSFVLDEKIGLLSIPAHNIPLIRSFYQRHLHTLDFTSPNDKGTKPIFCFPNCFTISETYFSTSPIICHLSPFLISYTL